jgi:hypothetical protein
MTIVGQDVRPILHDRPDVRKAASSLVARRGPLARWGPWEVGVIRAGNRLLWTNRERCAPSKGSTTNWLSYMSGV